MSFVSWLSKISFFQTSPFCVVEFILQWKGGVFQAEILYLFGIPAPLSLINAQGYRHASMPDTRVFIRRIPKRYKISTVWGKMGRFSRGILSGVSKTTLLPWYEGKSCNFFVFCDIFRRIAIQKQLFLAGLRHSVALGMEDFSAYATLLDFGGNLRCMKQVAGSLVRQVIF